MAFADKWDFSPPRYNSGINLINAANTAFLAGGALYMAAGSPLRAAFAAAATAGIFYVLPKLSSGVFTGLLNKYSAPAPAAMQKDIESFIQRAGITDGVAVRILNVPDTAKELGKTMRIKMNFGAAIVRMTYGPGTKSTMILGHETIKLLNQDELRAVVCHEISHVVNKNSPKGFKPVNMGLVMNLSLAATMLLTLDPKLAALSLGVVAGGKVLQGLAGQFDEFRADFNSAGQYPHPTALGDALKKIRAKYREHLYPDPYSLSFIYNYTKGKLFGEHPSVPRRIAAHEKRLPEVREFYSKNGIPLPC